MGGVLYRLVPSVTLGIDTAGTDVHFVQEEGESAMTKPRDPTHTVALVDDYCAPASTTARTFPITCMIHPSMQATVVVTP
jgi:hypothetical protein